MDATHFGSTAASKELVQIVQDNPRLRRRVCCLYAEYMQGMRQIANIPQATLRRWLYILWHQEHDAKARRLDSLEAANFLRNVLRAVIRAATRKGRN